MGFYQGNEGVIEVLQISEKSGTLVKTGVVLAIGTRWLKEKLHAVSELVMKQGNLDV